MSYIAHTHHLLRYNLMDEAMRIVSFFRFLSIATITTISLCNGNLGVPCKQNERQALLMFKKDLEYPSNRLLSWVGEGECCNWTGVVCNNLTVHVRELHLGNYYSDEYLNYSLYQENSLGGKIPSFLGSLRSLRYLNLSDSKFAGIIPHQLGNLSSLRSLGLRSKSYYSMKVENLQCLSGLSSLQNLDMSRVDLSKASDWFQVTNTLPSMLVELHMSGCELNQIPVGVANMTRLEVLNLRLNIIWGTIPQWLCTCTNLESLSLYLNLLRGEISSSIGNLTAIVSLDLSANQLKGKIPNSLGNLCPIPVSLGNLPFLEEASISKQGRLRNKVQENRKHFFKRREVESNNENQTLPSKEKCELALEGAGSQEHSDKIAMLVDDENLELRELQGWPNALGCSDHFTTNGDHACSLCNDFLAKFPPNSVKMKHPFCMQPWDSSPEIVKKLFKGSLNRLTWTEILRQALVAAGFGSKQGAMRRDALSKEMSLMVKYGLHPGTLKGELFEVLLERGIHGLKDSEFAKSLQISELNLSNGIEELEYLIGSTLSNTKDSGAVDDDLGDRGTCSSDDDSGYNSGNSKLKKLTYMKYGKNLSIEEKLSAIVAPIDLLHACSSFRMEPALLPLRVPTSSLFLGLSSCSASVPPQASTPQRQNAWAGARRARRARAATEGHSELKLIFQHFDNLSHAAFSFCCKAIAYRPSNLQQH
ncbi:unnamed protein product [Prunus armeniaca]